MEQEVYKKRIIEEKLEDIILFDGVQSIDNFINFINECKNKYIQKDYENIKSELYAWGDWDYHGTNLVIYGSKLESDIVYENRIKQYEKNKLKSLSQKEKSEQKERELYEKLHKKFGAISKYLYLNPHLKTSTNVLTGEEYGTQVRKNSDVDNIFNTFKSLEIIVPARIKSINPSFLEQLLLNIILDVPSFEELKRNIIFVQENNSNFDIENDLLESYHRIKRLQEVENKQTNIK